MIVVLHGCPGDGGKKRAHDTRSQDFQETLVLRIAATAGSDLACMYGPKIPAITKHTITFRFTHHDGTHYHYKFTGEVDL